MNDLVYFNIAVKQKKSTTCHSKAHLGAFAAWVLFFFLLLAKLL